MNKRMPMAAATLDGVMTHPGLFQPWFTGPSWNAWRSILRGAFALPMTEADRATFRELAQRDPPARRVKELWIVAGRRAGKDSIASMLAAYTGAFIDYRSSVRPGEIASVLCLAVDRPQARIVLNYTRAFFQRIPALHAMVTRETADGFELNNAAEILISTNDFRAVRGRTIALAIFDECAFWRDENSSSPDRETYNAVLPSLATLPNALLVGISSPYRKSGLLHDKYRRHFGKDGDVLVVQAPSLALNPTLDPAIVEEALQQDPEVAAAEWLGEFRNDLADVVSRETVESCVAPGVRELPPAAGISYIGFVDPSGGSSDSMTLAIGHRDRDNVAVLDCVREARAPFSPEAVVEEFAAVLRSYGIGSVRGDRYAGEWPREQFSKRGVSYEPAGKSKGELYIDFLPMLNSGRCQLLDVPRLVSQLCSLERRTARGGRDSIDHPPGAHDDLANAVAGLLAALRVTEAGWIEYYRSRREAAEQPRDRTPQTTAQQGMAGGRYADLLPKCDAEPSPASFPKPAQTKPGNALVTMLAPAPFAAFFASAPDGGSRKFTADGQGRFEAPSNFVVALEGAGCIIANDQKAEG